MPNESLQRVPGGHHPCVRRSCGAQRGDGALGSGNSAGAVVDRNSEQTNETDIGTTRTKRQSPKSEEDRERKACD